MIAPHSLPYADENILNGADGHMQAAQAKWERLTPDDLSSIHSEQELVARIQERYSLPHWVAVQDVQLWLKATARGW